MAVIYGSQVQPHLSFSVCPHEEITEHAGSIYRLHSWANERKDGRLGGWWLLYPYFFGSQSGIIPDQLLRGGQVTVIDPDEEQVEGKEGETFHTGAEF